MRDLIQVTNGVESTICEISRNLLKWLPLRRGNSNRIPTLFKYYQCQSFPTHDNNCFNGYEAIQTFTKYYNLPYTKAVEFGQTLLRVGIIHRIGTDADHVARTIFTSNGYFRLQSLQSPDILNSFRIWTTENGREVPAPDPIRTVSRLHRQMAELLTSATNDAGIVDYLAAREKSRFLDLEEAVCLLQLVDIRHVDEPTKKTFFINVYNLLANHGFVKLCPDKVKKGMFDKLKYNIGGFYFGLDDIYHGILRRNSKHPTRRTKMFSDSDQRLAFRLHNTDARIHFALDNNATNTNHHPTLIEYHVYAIDEELRIVAEDYCASNQRLSISSIKNKVVFPAFMETYRSDFTTTKGDNPRICGDDNHSLLEAITKYLGRDKRRYHELKKMLERGKRNGERVNVAFRKERSPSRSGKARRKKHISLQKVMSRLRKQHDANSISNYHSTIHELETVKSLDSPLQCIDLEQSSKRRLSDLSWDCTSELSPAVVEADGVLECAADTELGNLPLSSSIRRYNTEHSTDIQSTPETLRSKLAYPSYQVDKHITKVDPDCSVSDESSSQISFDTGSISAFTIRRDAHEHKTKPDYLRINYPCEYPLSDDPNGYSVCTNSTIGSSPSSRTDSDTDMDTSGNLGVNTVVGDCGPLYSNTNDASTIKTSEYTFSKWHKNSNNPEDDACAANRFSLGTKTTTCSSVSTNERTKSVVDSETSEIPRMNEFTIEPEHDECTFSYLLDDYSLETKSTLNSPTLSPKRRIKSGCDNETSDFPSMNEINAEVNTLFDSLFPIKSIH